jgi:hypothetical protein
VPTDFLIIGRAIRTIELFLMPVVGSPNCFVAEFARIQFAALLFARRNFGEFRYGSAPTLAASATWHCLTAAAIRYRILAKTWQPSSSGTRRRSF